jgi:hypothetical protein
MNSFVLLCAISVPLILIGIACVLGTPLPEEDLPQSADTIEDLLPLHTQHFPQLRQSLDSADSRYVHRRLSQALGRSWSAERQQIVRDYLTGLAGDCARVLRLGRIVDSLSLRISRRKIVERYWLVLRFRLLYRVVSASMSAGGPGMLRMIARLTGYVGSLSALEEAAMERLEIQSEERGVQSNFNA